jgi:hypothetical protein
MPTKWNLTGTYFEACNCDVGCPCVFTSDPTEGNCTVLFAWHIEKGKHGDLSLDGMNTALAVYSPGHMLKTKWDVALYIDEKANPAQRVALTTIFGGQAGGEPAALGPLIGKVLGVKPVPITYQAKGKERSMRIPNIAEMEIAAIDGQGGKLVTLENVPLTGVPNQTTVVGKSKKLSYHDHNMNWDITGKNGFYSPFSFKGP